MCIRDSLSEVRPPAGSRAPEVRTRTLAKCSMKMPASTKPWNSPRARAPARAPARARAPYRPVRSLRKQIPNLPGPTRGLGRARASGIEGAQALGRTASEEHEPPASRGHKPSEGRPRRNTCLLYTSDAADDM
eukprot:3467634-Alexandrium_andersonii.AAC.1